MAVQDDHMIRNIQDVGRLIAKLLLHEQDVYKRQKQDRELSDMIILQTRFVPTVERSYWQ